MAHFKKLPQKENVGKIVYGDKIVDEIVMLAVSELDNIELCNISSKKTRASGIKVFFDKDGVNVDVAIKIHASQNVSDMAFKVQEVVRHNVESMTEYHVASVNVIVNGVNFDEIKPVNVEENQ